MELSMNISTNGDRGLNWLNVAFLDQNFLYLFAKDSEFSFWQYGTVFDGLEPRINVTGSHLLIVVI